MFGRRVNIVLLVFLALGGGLIARLAYWQLVLGPCDEDRLRTGRPPLLETTRGAIYTADGVLLARDATVFDLSVRYSRLVGTLLPREATASELAARYSRLVGASLPGEMAEFDLSAYRRRLVGDDADRDWTATVSRLTGRPAEELHQAAWDVVRLVERMWWHRRTRSGREDLIREQVTYYPVVENVPARLAVLLRTHAEDYPDLEVACRTARVHNSGDLAPHVVGTVGRITPAIWERLRDNGEHWMLSMDPSQIGQRYLIDDCIGVIGIERSCEHLLRGRRGHVESKAFWQGLRIERRSWPHPPQPGQDVCLTLREDLQQAVNETLRWATRQPELNFRSGSLVILDVRSGAVLAAGTYPSYSLEGPVGSGASAGAAAQLSPRLFRPTQAALPPGSVFKIVTATAGLEEGKITPSTIFNCTGSLHGRRCTARWGHGETDLGKAIERSCNVYFWQTALLVKGGPLARWGRAFGLGSRTGVDLPYEKAGQVPSRPGTMNLAIGQGSLLCTPLQVARLCAAIANGGKLVRPHFFDHAVGRDGKVTRRSRPEVETISVSPETLRLVREGMRRVVQSGTAKGRGLERFDVAGKTGTAERERGQPNHAWFAGFAPFDRPKIAFAVVSEMTPGHGGDSAAPILAHALEAIWPEIERMP